MSLLEPGNGMATCIVIGNGKGGVGKSTTTLSLGAIFARRGLATLMIDYDPSASVSKICGAPMGRNDSNVCDTLEDLDFDPFDAVYDVVSVPNLAVMPSRQRLTKVWNELLGEGGSEACLQRVVGDPRLAGEFDVILVDTAPRKDGLAFTSAKRAAEWLLVVSGAGDDELDKGYETLSDLEHQQRRDPSLTLEFLGLLITNCHPRTRVVAHALERLQRDGVEGFDDPIPHAVAVKELHAQNKLFVAERPSHPVSLAYSRVADAMTTRIAAMSAVEA